MFDPDPGSAFFLSLIRMLDQKSTGSQIGNTVQSNALLLQSKILTVKINSGGGGPNGRGGDREGWQIASVGEIRLTVIGITV